MRPIAVDLFAGAGGLSLGFEQAGFDVVAAVEVDPIHCAVHKFNFPETSIIPRSVVGLTAQEIRNAAGIGNRVIDCVFGGPPCQGFSLIGHRVLDDPRNGLVLEFVRIVAELDARTFVFENVKGLTVGNHQKFLAELVTAFKAAGYDVQLPWKVLNAVNFSVPQHRERLVLMGAKKGHRLPRYPHPTTRNPKSSGSLSELPLAPTCYDAISDLPDASQFDALLQSDEVSGCTFGEPSKFAAEMRCLTNDSWHFGYSRHWIPQILTSSARTIHTEISQRRFKETIPGQVEPVSRFFKLSPDGIANTLRAGTDGARGAFTSPRPIHFKHDRCITVREMARLHGFPDWFRLHATKWHGARQIGNSVPPPLARAIASCVIESIGVKPTRPIGVVELGDPLLLTAEMSKAAGYFDVPPPHTRRDRKSGAKKRKQVDIERARFASLEAAE